MEVRWLAPAAATLALALALLLPAAAGASPASRAEHWLTAAQNADGGFGPVPGVASSRLYTGWAGLGLAAAGHNPRDLKRRGGRSLAAYVTRDGRTVKDIGEVERTVLLLAAAGLSPRDFGGRDLVELILGRRRGDGSIAGFVSYTTFGVLALRSAGVSPGAKTVAWLVSAQNADGGFGLAPASSSDSDMTGATLQALAVVGRQRVGVAQRAVAWLRANQNDDGGFGQFRGRDSNAQSTAYAVQGLVAVGAGGATLKRALAYLRGLQRANGSVSYSSSSNQTPVWVTAQALMALERKPLPIAAVARQPQPKRKQKSEPAAAPAASPKPKREKPAGSTGYAPAETGSDVATQSRLVTRPKSPAAALELDRAAGDQDDPGPPAWVLAIAVLGVLGGLFALRRKLVPALWHSQGP
jgi:energy-coupling factor transport system substrate-specific component